MSPDERAAAAEDHEAAAVMAAEEWEARALLDEAEIGHLRTLAAVLERHALPLLDPERPLAETNDVTGYEFNADGHPTGNITRMPDWALPPAVLAASAGIDEGIAAAREWSAGELDAMRERVANGA